MRTWNLSTAAHRLAAAFISISVATATRGGGTESAPQPQAVAAVELEAQLAKTPAVYLVVDTVRRVIDIRARALNLDRLALKGIEVVVYQPFFSSRQVPMPELPAIWTIENGPGDTDRETIAPKELRPYSSGDEEEEAPATPVPTPVGPTPTPTPVPEPPVRYRAHLDNGWDLWVVDALPARDWPSRFAEAVRDGWRRLHGEEVRFRPALALAMEGEDARRLHHLMRTGTKILVVATP